MSDHGHDHDHDHDGHGHGHGHGHGPDSPENPDAGQGFVMLDIGGDIGAIVVTMPVELVGHEVEIEPVGGIAPDAHRDHVAVVRRPIVGGQIPALVFPDLVEGDYHLFHKGSDDVEMTVTVRGGEVASVDWPGVTPQ